jgi:hypothetical protein
MYEATEGRSNPFLHLSMHLSVSEHRPAPRHTPSGRAAHPPTQLAAPRPPRSHGVLGHHAVGKPARRQTAGWGCVCGVCAATCD